jgi:hypothetical protein
MGLGVLAFTQTLNGAGASGIHSNPEWGWAAIKVEKKIMVAKGIDHFL